MMPQCICQQDPNNLPPPLSVFRVAPACESSFDCPDLLQNRLSHGLNRWAEHNSSGVLVIEDQGDCLQFVGVFEKIKRTVSAYIFAKRLDVLSERRAPDFPK